MKQPGMRELCKSIPEIIMLPADDFYEASAQMDIIDPCSSQEQELGEWSGYDCFLARPYAKCFAVTRSDCEEGVILNRGSFLVAICFNYSRMHTGLCMRVEVFVIVPVILDVPHHPLRTNHVRVAVQEVSVKNL